MNYLKYAPLAGLLLFSNIAFASMGAINVDLGSVTAPAGGKTLVQLSLDPIKPYATSLWNITCSIPNPSNNNVVMQFGIVMTTYASWPQAQLNDRYIGIAGNGSQASLNPGENKYMLSSVDNKAFPFLNFTNFDDSQDVTVKCSAVLQSS